MPKNQTQRAFFASMADPQAFRAMFEQLPDVFFFVKNRDSRMIAATGNLLQRLGVKSESAIIGTRDEDFFPPHVARSFRDDDERVFRTGQPLTNRLEVWYDEQHNLDWFLTSKVPLRGKNGKVIGLMGITRRDEGRAAHQPENEVTRVVNHLQQSTSRALSTAELARECGMSERTLYRKISQILGTTPYELMLRIRIQKAAEALIKTTDKVIEIAIAHGFCDQSTFTHHFRKRTGMTPKEFRMRHQT
jgi:AraC-like DNA-binding protein